MIFYSESALTVKNMLEMRVANPLLKTIALAHHSNIQLMILKPAVGRWCEIQAKRFGYIAKFNDLDDKLNIIKNYKRLSEN